AEIEVLRALHRDLVALQQTWEALPSATFLSAFPGLTCGGQVSDRQEASTGLSAALASNPSPRASMPLPAEGVVARPASGRAPTRSSWLRPVHKQRQQQRLVLVLAVLVLVIAGTGGILLQGWTTPASNTHETANSVNQPTPLATTPPPSTQPQPTSTQ